jgi:SAM-dependent methyltransferase
MTKRRKIVPIHAPAGPPVHPFDRDYGTDTGGLIPRAELATGHPSDAHVTAYYAVAPSILNELIDVWLGTKPRFAIDRYTFLDVGAGKGRAMLTASLQPFERVTGIELNPALAAIARANMNAFAARASPLAPVELLQGDALEVPLADTPTVAFLFHPFEAPLLRRFLARLAQHFSGRTLDVLYVNAEHTAVFDQHPDFQRVFYGMVPMSGADHLADLAEIAMQEEYGSTGDEICAIYRLSTEPTGYAGDAS